ncbi:uncharacterized protein MELLADRAFT_106158 [Melampsora larici-populina 98AG31]|uniref:Uncharacterized protein n=1 Tax=Melampsora larici-populina (strain 98AG31 / pathotype 3-4-7) TaxID=747676 RepID=F4RKK7_MELLP|nr:uncharacterized protein MELLADRAFT_106158 [Melampsora larici-populina 98AG31]EGG07110.1 hypothetical protein MELLADRAFT_106158 [Melampsora larici-populina 98AG31]
MNVINGDETETKPNPNLYSWTNLPGYLIKYLHNPFLPKISSNPQAFDRLQSLLKVPLGFYEAYDEEVEKTLWYVKLDSRLNEQLSIEFVKLEKEFKEIGYFLGLNSGYLIKEISPFDGDSISQIRSSNDWILFSSINLNLLFQLGYKDDEEGNHEIQEFLYQLKLKKLQVKFKVAVLGVWEDELNQAEKIKTIRAENLRFLEVWKKDYLITFTSKAASSHPQNLQRFFQKLQYLSFNPEASPRFISWLHIITFHQLNPTKKPNQSIQNPSPHSPNTMRTNFSNLNAIHTIYKTNSWPCIMIQEMFCIKKDKVYLSDHFTEEEEEEGKGYFHEVLSFEKMREISDSMDQRLRDLSKNEVKVLISVSTAIGIRFWDLIALVVVVSDLEKFEFQRLGNFSCQMMTFDEVLELMDKETVEI